jgi:type I pantothenate kinase
VKTADAIWTSINLANLHKNILPTRQRADLILRKGDDHRIRDVYLRGERVDREGLKRRWSQ